jgi:hypothetical protein
MNYKHTQIGTLMITVLFAIAIYFIVLYMYADLNTTAVLIMILVLFLIASFSTLTVMIDEQMLRIKFGYGIFSKQFLLKEIKSVKTVQNKWYFGWGIRFWFWPRMTIFNISGFDAVELQMNNGKLYRIGTDEPKKLESTIQTLLKRR